jgi:hypothetical protein
MKPVLMLPGGSRLDYCKKAAKFARRRFNALLETQEYRHCHESHAVSKALLDTEKAFPDLGTFGVEGTTEANGDDLTIDYLNTGDTYGLTVLYYKGRFLAGNWGPIAERFI